MNTVRAKRNVRRTWAAPFSGACDDKACHECDERNRQYRHCICEHRRVAQARAPLSVEILRDGAQNEHEADKKER